MPALVDCRRGIARTTSTRLRTPRCTATPLAAASSITHSHVDHLVQVWSPRSPRARRPGSREAMRRVRSWGWRHGERVTGGRHASSRVLHTPGHSPDHCCLFEERSGDLYCGDLARQAAPSSFPRRQRRRPRAYLASLRARRDLRAEASASGPRSDRRRSARADRRSTSSIVPSATQQILSAPSPAARTVDGDRLARSIRIAATCLEQCGRCGYRARAPDQAAGRGSGAAGAGDQADVHGSGLRSLRRLESWRQFGQPFGRFAARGSASRITCSSSSR